MKTNMNDICNNYIVNYNTVKSVFKHESEYIYPICANVFCTHNRIISEDELIQSNKILKENISAFSNFRGLVKAYIASIIAVSDNSEKVIKKMTTNYDLLKKEFSSSSYLTVISIILSELFDDEKVVNIISKGKELYKKIKKEHPLLTSSEDVIFAILLVLSEKSTDQLIVDMEESYKILKPLASNNVIQSVSHILAFSNKSPAEKSEYFKKFIEAINSSGLKYSKDRAFTTLASLSIIDADMNEIIDNIKEVDEFLSKQKPYKGVFGFDQKSRFMNAAMLVSNVYSNSIISSAAVSTSTIAIVAAQQAALCAIITSTAATSALTATSSY
ncbi:DUF4003 family protein [Ruminococcus sp.]|uniref:DUF4003 family protein n=1 Tax=Ruminococcus sp. TaxID=41978 RepID=UPI0025FAE67F|nr:DUF4003 family protein [Ruminococcus sp.]